MFFPLDLVDNVVEYLRDDIETLKICCQVSQAFIIPSRKILFSKITLIGPISRNYSDLPCKRLYDCFVSNTYLPYAIQELRIEGGAWAVQEPTFPALVELLSHSEHLRVFSMSFKLKDYVTHSDDHWNNLPLEFTRPIIALLRSPRLEILRIRLEDSCACTFPVELFGSVASTLKSLTFIGDHECWCTHEFGPDPNADASAAIPIIKRPQPLALEVLETGGTDVQRVADFFGHPNCCFRLTSLRRLVFRGSRLNAGFTAGVWRILMASKNIETLAWIHPHYRRGYTPDTIDLRVLQCIRTLIFVVRYYESDFAALHGLLVASRIPSTVERLVFLVEEEVEFAFFESGSPTAFEIDNALFDYFGNTDDEGSSVPKYDITLYMLLRRRGTLEEEYLKTNAGLRAYFPRLDSTGRLSEAKLGDIRKIDELVEALASE